jgi:hypothetical protein
MDSKLSTNQETPEAKVRLQGLKRDVHLNGKTGTAVAYSAEKDWFAVKFVGEETLGMFVPKNIAAVDEENSNVLRRLMEQDKKGETPPRSKLRFEETAPEYASGERPIPVAKVRIQGLKNANAQAFNGRDGTVVSFNFEKSRFSVQIGTETKLLRPENVVGLDGYESSVLEIMIKSKTLTKESIDDVHEGIRQLHCENDPLHVMIIPVMGQGDPLCIIYTKGLFEKHGLPELLVIDVPVDRMQEMAYFVTHMAAYLPEKAQAGKMYHGYKLEFEGIESFAVHAQSDRQREAFIGQMGMCNTHAQVIVLMPALGAWETEAPALPRDLKGKTHHVQSVITKWRQYRQMEYTITRFSFGELKKVPKAESLLRDILSGNVADASSALVPNWTEQDAVLVRENTDYLRQFALLELCCPDLVRLGLFLDEVASNLWLAPERYSRGEKVSQGNYRWEQY